MSDPVFDYTLGGATPAPQTRRVLAFYEQTGLPYNGPLAPLTAPDAEWFSAKTSSVNAPIDYVFTLDAAKIANRPAGKSLGKLHLTSSNPQIVFSPLDIIVTLNITDPNTPPPPINQAPVVVVNDDFAITLPAKALLIGHVTDDALPQPALLALQWRKVSGPGIVTFDNPTAAQTQASFSIAGAYVVALDANDGILIGSDACNIVVSAPTPPATDTIPPVVTIQPLRWRGKKTTIAAKATDNIGVEYIEILIDNELRANNPGAAITFLWITSGLVVAKHVIEARAYDAAGNYSSAFMQVLLP